MDKSQNYYVECNKPNEKKYKYYMIEFLHNSRKCKLINRNRNQISGCLEMEGEEGMDYKVVWGCSLGW